MEVASAFSDFFLGAGLLPYVRGLTEWVSTLRWGNFLPPESHQRPPKAGPSPALWNPPRGTGWSVRHSIFSPWPGEVTWMACRSMGCIYFSVGASFYRQGFTLVSRCSQLPDAWLPAAGTPHPQSRPGHGNRPAIGPVAQGGLVWWQEQGPQRSSSLVPQGRSLGGNALSGFWFLLPAQKKPPAGSAFPWLASLILGCGDGQSLSLPCGSQLPLHKGAL